jgi:hypothetical protein
MVITAAHCVYNSEIGSFARNAIFIPNQDANGGITDYDCTNDITGCWDLAFGTVDIAWSGNSWPNSIPVDYVSSACFKFWGFTYFATKLILTVC